MLEFEAFGIALIPVIIGLVEVLKGLGLPDKIAPAASLILGIVAGVFYASPGDIMSGILVGIALGLSASGLYSGSKAVIEKE